MKYYFTRIIVLLAFGFCFQEAGASHLMAGEITYKNIGKDSFEITVKIYRDCNGIPMSNSPLEVKTGTCSTFTRPLTLASLKDVTGISPRCNILSKCDTASGNHYAYGIEEYTFKGLLVLPTSSCCKVTLGWTQCCRNNVISTGAAGQNYYMETSFDRCLAANNTSPQFMSLPVILLPVGQDININHTAIDPDNDFITYELVNPYNAPGSQISYQSSWSAEKPISFLGFPNAGLSLPAGFHFDSSTSNMSFRPTKKDEATVVTIRVKEWRMINGVRTQIGEVVRDVQLLVIDNGGNNKAPQFAPSVSTVIKACTPGTYCIVIPVTDADSADSVFVDYKHNFAGMQVTKNYISANHVELKICYSITSAMFLTKGSYFLSLYAYDSHCPLPGKAEKSYYLRLDTSLGAIITLPKIAALCENTPPFPLIGSPAYGTWTGPGVMANDTFVADSAGPGWHKLVYTYADTSSGCVAKDSLRVRILQQPVAGFTFNPSTGTTTDTFHFTNTTTADTVFQSVWIMGMPTSSNNVQLTPNAWHVYSAPGTFVVQLRVSNGICRADSTNDTVVVTGPVPVNSPAGSTLKIYPNPANDFLILEAENTLTSVTLTDVLGGVYFSGKMNTNQLNLANVPVGIYYLEATDETGQVYTAKILVQR